MSQNLYTTLRDRVVAILAELVPTLDPAVLARVEVTPARDPAHGDMATNAALLAAKPSRRAPAAIAADLAARLCQLPEIAHAEAAGPGFVNLHLRPAALQAILPIILRAGARFGDGTVGQGRRVNLEYVSANPTGPLTVGHCRGAVVGDALATLMAKAGYAVTREYYVNDAGNQVNVLAWAVYWRYLQALGTAMTEAQFAAGVPGGMQYKGDYLIAIGADLAARHGAAYAAPGLTVADPAGWLTQFRDETMAILLAEIRRDLARLGVQQDVFTSERAILAEGAPDAAIAALDAKGLIYQGVLEPPKGKLPEDWEPREQTLFAATRFGDDVDRPLRKSDGSNTYFANDIGYHADKLRRGFDIVIDVLGADHGGYVSRMSAAVKALSDGNAEFDVVLCQIVHVLRGGVPVKMSKRAGTYVTLADLLDEVGPDAVRFTMLMRKNDAQMEFDIDAAIAQTRDNPVFYVQYAHARCRSVLRMAGDQMAGIDDTTLAQADLAGGGGGFGARTTPGGVLFV
jgi:arginyl-tRNA synthetase